MVEGTNMESSGMIRVGRQNDRHNNVRGLRHSWFYTCWMLDAVHSLVNVDLDHPLPADLKRYICKLGC
jgi:hypothetical protein